MLHLYIPISFTGNQKDMENISTAAPSLKFEVGDKAAIEVQIDAMIQSWNNHNYDDLESYTTENTDWVNNVGMWWKGRKESQYAHQFYHNTFFKDVEMKKKFTTIRFLTKEVALAHLIWHYGGYIAPDGKKYGDTDGLATLVFVKVKGKWMMAAGQNGDIVSEVQQFDPVKQMPSY
jgi:uncharacterized protein (TIGR02246 family)